MDFDGVPLSNKTKTLTILSKQAKMEFSLLNFNIQVLKTSDKLFIYFTKTLTFIIEIYL